jgi:hypothetical protein
LKTELLKQFQALEGAYRPEAKQYEEVRQMIDLEVMRDSHVVGMTTTGAARLHTLLQALKPRIGGQLHQHHVVRCVIYIAIQNKFQNYRMNLLVFVALF